jgi:hypothetical protein
VGSRTVVKSCSERHKPCTYPDGSLHPEGCLQSRKKSLDYDRPYGRRCSNCKPNSPCKYDYTTQKAKCVDEEPNMAAWRLLLAAEKGQAQLRRKRDELLSTFDAPPGFKGCLMLDRIDKPYGSWSRWQCCDTCEEN